MFEVIRYFWKDICAIIFLNNQVAVDETFSMILSSSEGTMADANGD